MLHRRLITRALIHFLMIILLMKYLDENVDDAPPADVSPRNVHLSDVDPADGPPNGDSHSAAQPCDDHADDAPASNIPLEDLPHHEQLEDDEGSLDETDDEASDRPSERK